MPISDEIMRRLADIDFGDYDMRLRFEDGGSVSAPYWWYPRLRDARPDQRRNFEVSGAGRGIHWPDIDEDLSINGILEGRRAPGAVPPAEAAE